MIVLLETMFQHVLGISVRCWIRCSNILARFSVPWFMPICTRALYYLRKSHFRFLLTKQRAYLSRISCVIFLKVWLYFRKYLKLFWTFLQMFLHFTTFHICLWFLFVDQLNDLQFLLKPNKVNWLILLQYKRKISRPNWVF